MLASSPNEKCLGFANANRFLAQVLLRNIGALLEDQPPSMGRRIGQREVSLGRQRFGWRNLELPRLAARVELQSLLRREARRAELCRHGWVKPAGVLCLRAIRRMRPLWPEMAVSEGTLGCAARPHNLCNGRAFVVSRSERRKAAAATSVF